MNCTQCGATPERCDCNPLHREFEDCDNVQVIETYLIKLGYDLDDYPTPF